MQSFDNNNGYGAGAAQQSQGVNLFTKDDAIFCNQGYFAGSILSNWDIVANQNLVALNGYVYNDEGGAIASLSTAAFNSVAAAVANAWTYENTTLTAWANTQWGAYFSAQWYYPGRPGNTATINSMWASLRADADYKAQAFSLYETRWAQMARASTYGAPTTWTENPVETNVPATPVSYPFPGVTKLTYDTTTYKQHSFLLHDPAHQRAVDRAASSSGSVYEAPVTLNMPLYGKLDGRYPIIGKS
jgi:hypothetical protein